MLKAIFALIRIFCRRTDPAPMSPAEIDAALDQRAGERGEVLNHRESAVDLFKTLSLDSSLKNRAATAADLGFKETFTGTAEQNEWLIRAIREKFSKGEEIA